MFAEHGVGPGHDLEWFCTCRISITTNVMAVIETHVQHKNKRRAKQESAAQMIVVLTSVQQGVAMDRIPCEHYHVTYIEPDVAPITPMHLKSPTSATSLPSSPLPPSPVPFSSPASSSSASPSTSRVMSLPAHAYTLPAIDNIDITSMSEKDVANAVVTLSTLTQVKGVKHVSCVIRHVACIVSAFDVSVFVVVCFVYVGVLISIFHIHIHIHIHVAAVSRYLS